MEQSGCDTNEFDMKKIILELEISDEMTLKSVIIQENDTDMPNDSTTIRKLGWTIFKACEENKESCAIQDLMSEVNEEVALMDRAHEWKKRYEKAAIALSKFALNPPGLVQIKLVDGSYVPNCRKVSRKEDFDITKRCFYELGKYVDEDQVEWRRSGEFKEVVNLEKFLVEDMRFNDQKWIDHHNYHQTI